MEQAKILKLYDFRELAIPEKLLQIRVPKKEVEEAMMQAAKRTTQILPVEGPVQKGDIVIADFASENPGWQKKGAHVNVGMDFSGAEVEETLLGMKLGEEKQIKLEGNDVAVWVTGIRRLSVCSLTDADVAAMKIDDVDTVEEYRTYVFQKKLDRIKGNKLNALVMYVYKKIYQNSEFEIPESAVQERLKMTLEGLRSMENGKAESSEEELLMEYVSRYLGKNPKTMEEARKIAWNNCLDNIKAELAGAAQAERDHKEFNRETYEKYVRFLSELTETPIEEMRDKALNYEVYLAQAPMLYLINDLLPAYYKDRFVILTDETAEREGL